MEIKIKLNDRIEYARGRYLRHPNTEILELSIETDNSKTSHNLSVPEAESLIEGLQELINDLKN